MLWKYAKDTPKEKFIIELLTSPQEIISSLGKITDSAFHTSMLMYIEHLFTEVSSKAQEIKETIYNFFSDFNDFLAMMLRCLEFLTPNSPEYSRYIEMMVSFGSTFNQDSSGSQILFLENFGLSQILAFAKRISNKKDALVKIMLSICGPEESKRLRLLRRMEKMLGGDYATISGLLAHMSIDQAEIGFSGELFEFYWTKAITVINGTCNPKIKAAGLKILNELSIDNYKNLPEVYPTLRRLCTETWWEVKSQILIICANQLNLIELAAREDEIKQKDRSNLQNTQEHGEETVEAAIPKIEAEMGGANVGFGTLAAGHISKGSVGANENNSQMEQTDKHLRSNLNKSNEGEFEKTQQSFIGEPNEGGYSKSNSIVHLIDLVSRIFHTDANVNVQKVGLVYLAPVLNYYPELCPRFLEVLLSVEDDVRETVLSINQDSLSEYNIVISSTSFKYSISGAPLVWSSVGIAEALDQFVQASRLEFFEPKHIQILYGALERKIEDHRLDVWLKVYKDLQKYIFISLTDSKICEIAASIIKKFFAHKKLSEDILPITKDLLLKIIVNIYQPDISQEARENLLELFQHLERQGDDFAEYVFQIVKTYSEKHKAAFLKSNLVNFMNNLARTRRQKYFGESTIPTAIPTRST